jgi:DNA-binding transcriptional LysR family regulator
MLGYARRLLDLNDEVLGRLTATDYTGQITLGVPHDIVYPAIPQVLQRFNTDFPRMRVQLVSSYTSRLKAMFARGEIDVILTTEDEATAGGETLITRSLIWVGADGGQVWKQRPLRLAFEHNCIFRRSVQDALDRAAISWEMAVESDSSRTVEASVSADLAVHACIEGTEPPYVERIDHNGGLPNLPEIRINLYRAELARGAPADALTEAIRQAYRACEARLSPHRDDDFPGHVTVAQQVQRLGTGRKGPGRADMRRDAPGGVHLHQRRGCR